MRRLLWFAVGVVLLGVGLLFVLTAPPPGATDFGWFAYTPLEGSDADWYFGWDEPGRGVIMSRGVILGSAVGVLGLLVLATGVAYRLGGRHARASAGSTDL